MWAKDDAPAGLPVLPVLLGESALLGRYNDGRRGNRSTGATVVALGSGTTSHRPGDDSNSDDDDDDDAPLPAMGEPSPSPPPRPSPASADAALAARGDGALGRRSDPDDRLGFKDMTRPSDGVPDTGSGTDELPPLLVWATTAGEPPPGEGDDPLTSRAGPCGRLLPASK